MLPAFESASSDFNYPKNRDMKISFLVNNQRKKIAFLIVLFFAFAAQDDLNILFLKVPSFDQLTISEGKLSINESRSRVSEIFTLVIDNQKISFNCGTPGGGNTACAPFEKIQDYQGKSGKAWWFRTKNVNWLDDARLYQLEVDGKLEISYQKQVERYLSMKSSYYYPSIIFLFTSIIVFLLLQFTNDPITPNRNEK